MFIFSIILWEDTRVLQNILSLQLDFWSVFYQKYFYCKPSTYSLFTENNFVKPFYRIVQSSLFSLWLICQHLYLDKIHKNKFHSFSKMDLFKMVRIKGVQTFIMANTVLVEQLFSYLLVSIALDLEGYHTTPD